MVAATDEGELEVAPYCPHLVIRKAPALCVKGPAGLKRVAQAAS